MIWVLSSTSFSYWTIKLCCVEPLSSVVHPLSCSWRPPPGRSPAPLWEERWGEVLSRSPAPRCSCNRSTSPTPHPDTPRSLWRYARSNFLKVVNEGSNSDVWFDRTGEYKLIFEASWRWKSYFRCLMVWNCPWGSRGNYKAAQRRKHLSLQFYHCSIIQQYLDPRMEK